MSISLQPAFEAKLRQNAKSEGLTVEQYLERLVLAAEQATQELEILALDGLNSGEPIEMDAKFWEERHLRLDENLKKTGTR